MRQRQVSHDIAHMSNLKKNGTNELIYKTEIESQLYKEKRKEKPMVTRSKGEGG